MPLQNRVNPFGEIIATPARGAWMGNRGCLHDSDKHLLKKRWTRKAWVTCALEFRGWQRNLMSPGHYTELFFLDEATAFSAGHRPCAECRRAEHQLFKDMWTLGNPGTVKDKTIKVVDEYLHGERVVLPSRQHQAWNGQLAEVPDGAFVQLADSDHAWLVWQGRLWQWSDTGYSSTREVIGSVDVRVLTPRSICRAFLMGYSPQIDASVRLAPAA